MQTRPLMLHLGCGSTVVPGWVNIDESPGVLVPQTVRRLLGRAHLISLDQAAAVFPLQTDPLPVANANLLHTIPS